MPPDKIASAWAALAPLVDKFIDRDFYDPIHVRNLLLNGIFKLWVAGTRKGIEAIALVEPIRLPKGHCLVIYGCASGPNSLSERWIDHLPTIEQWAKEKYGCRKARIEGRSGWARKLPRYKRVGHILEYTL